MAAKRVARIRLALLCLALMMIAGVLVVALRERRQAIVVHSAKQQEPSDNASITVSNILYSTTDKENIKEWDLRAESAHYFNDQNKVVLKNLTLFLYRPGGKTYCLTADHGELYGETKNIMMRGRVTAQLPDKTEIQVATVLYDHARRTVSSADSITIKRERFSMEGVGMVINLDEEKLSVLGKVRALGTNE